MNVGVKHVQFGILQWYRLMSLTVQHFYLLTNPGAYQKYVIPGQSTLARNQCLVGDQLLTLFDDTDSLKKYLHAIY